MAGESRSVFTTGDCDSIVLKKTDKWLLLCWSLPTMYYTISYYHILYPPLFLYSTTSLHHYSTIPQLQTSYFPNLCSSYQTFLLEIWKVLDEPVVTMSQEESVEAPLLDIQVHKLIKLFIFVHFQFPISDQIKWDQSNIDWQLLPLCLIE